MAITATATELLGLATTLSRPINVDRTAPIVPALTLDRATPTVGETTTLTASSVDGGLGSDRRPIVDRHRPRPRQRDASQHLVIIAERLIPATLAPGSCTVAARSDR